MSHTIVLTSKLSRTCQNFEHLLSSIQNIFPVRIVNIDNEQTREKILSSTTLQVKQVPCVLIVYSTNTIEKYEGNDAFMWVNSNIQKFTELQKPMIPETTMISDQTSMISGPINQTSMISQPQTTVLTENITDLNLESDIKPKKSKKKPYVPQSLMNVDIENTSDEEIMEEPEYESSDEEVINSGSKSIMDLATAMEKDREQSFGADKTSRKQIMGIRGK
jgi:hypothetical protein